MKKLIALLLALLMMFSLIACGTETEEDKTDADEAEVEVETEVEAEVETEEEVEEEEEEEDLFASFDAAIYTEAFVGAMFTPDMGFIFNDMAPAAVSDKLVEVTGEEEFNAMIDEMNASIQVMIDEMAAQGDWNYRVDILSETVLTEEEIADLVVNYEDLALDLAIEAAVTVEADIVAIVAGEESPVTSLPVTFICIDGEWFLDLSTLSL